MLPGMTDTDERCIVVSNEQQAIDTLVALGEPLLVVRGAEEAFAAIRANPGQPVFVDVAAFPDLPKQIRIREDGNGFVPGTVVGYASPVRQDVIEAAELFCDEVILRPTVMRTLPALATRLRQDVTAT